MDKPWYKSLKKWLGVIFAFAVLVGGMIDIIRNPSNTVEILKLWGLMSGTFLGLTSGIKLGHKMVDNAKKDKPE